ncbi:MAG TPA: hypothetical protein VFZ61_21800 [Polyangiales bacterium]
MSQSSHLTALALAGASLAIAAPAAAQSVYSNVRVLHLGVHNTEDGHIEVTFDKAVCANPVQYSNMSFLWRDSPNREFLLSLVLAAFTSFRPVQIQTTDDTSCRILSLSVLK